MVFNVFMPFSQASAAETLSITPITWNVIGLDSNNPLAGPNTFPVAARICNEGTTAALNATSTFVWDSTDPYIDLTPGSITSFTGDLATPSLAPGACVDHYYNVTVTQTKSAYNHTRAYHITASSDNFADVSTPANRELFVEYLVSQNRNSTTSLWIGESPTSLTEVTLGGAIDLVIGRDYYIQLNAQTAPGGYNELESFVNLPNTVFKIESVEASYFQTDPGIDLSLLYADSCGWDNDTTSPTYRSCVVDDGKTGGTLTLLYHLTVLSTSSNSASLNTLIYDFSGSSYHYNSDFSSPTIRFNFTSEAAFSKTFNPASMLSGETTTLTFHIENLGSSSLTNVSFDDPLPTGVVVASPDALALGAACLGAPVVIASGSTISVSALNVAASSTCDISVNVTSTTAGTYDNVTSSLLIDGTDSAITAANRLVVTDAVTGTGCLAANMAIYRFETVANGGSLTSPLPTYNTFTNPPTAALGAGLKPYTNDPNPNHTASPTGTSSWGYQGTNSGSTQKGALDLTQNTYYEFIVDTTGLDILNLSFYFAALLQGPTKWTLYAYPEGELAANNTSLATGTIVGINGATTWTAGTHGFDLTKAIPDVNLSGNTVFRLYVSDAGADNAGVGDAFLDDVVFNGCDLLQPTMTKVFNPALLSGAGSSVLTLTLSNPNVFDLSGAAFEDVLPAGLTASNVQTTCSGGDTSLSTSNTISLTNGTIPSGGTCTVTADIQVGNAGTYLNISGPLVTTEGGTATTEPASSTVALGANPVFTKQFIPSTFYSGGNTLLRFSIENLNDVSLTGVAFSDILPTGLLVNADTPYSTCGGTLTAGVGTDTISLTGGSIAANTSCLIEVGITSTTVGDYTNITGDLTTDQNTDPVTATGNTSVTQITPAIVLSKQVSKSASGPWGTYVNPDLTLSEQVYYRFIVENIGDADLTDVVVTDPDLDLSSCSLSTPFALPTSDPIVSCVVGPISPILGTVNNTASVSGLYNVTSVTDTSSATYEATASGPAMTLLKEISGSASGPWSDSLLGITVGSDVYYQFTITNTGDVPLTITAISDDKLPAVDLTTCSVSTTLAVSASTSCVYGPVTSVEGIHVNTATADYSYQSTTGSASSSAATYAAGSGIVDGTVWVDTNTDTIIDAGESGISGAAVQLYYDANNDGVVDSGDLLMAETTTAVDGTYSFGSVPFSGATIYNYLIVLTDPSGYTYSGSNKTVSSSGSARIIQLPNFSADSTDNNYGYTLPVSGTPNLTISKSNNTNGVGTVGIPFTWVITGTNSGDATATFNDGDVLLTDTLAATASYGAISVYTTGTTGTGTISCSITSDVLTCSASGGTVEIPSAADFIVEVVVTPSSGTQISNFAEIDPNKVVSESNDNDNTSNTDTVTLNTVVDPDLSIVKSNDLAGADAAIGVAFDWILTVSNASTGGATFAQGTVLVSDSLPAGPTYGSPSVTSITNVTNAGDLLCAVNSGIFTCSASGGAITLGANAEFVVHIPVTPAASGSITNTAEVDPDNTAAESDETNNTDTNTINIANQVYDLAITKTDSVDLARTGETLRYTITVKNKGTEPVTGAIVTDPAVSGLVKTATACSPIPGVCSTAPSIADLEGTGFGLPTIPAGQNYQFVVDALVTATNGNVVNTATVAMPNGIIDSKNTNNSATDSDNVAFFGLALNKFTTASQYSAAGNMITYHYTLTNQSDAPLYAPFTVSDDKFPSDLVCTAADGILSVGEVLLCEADYTITAADVTAGSVTNTAFATAFNAASGGSEVVSNTDMVTLSYQPPTPPPPAGSAIFRKQISGDGVNWYDSIAIASGSTVHYRLSLQNTGSVALSNVAIYDNMTDCQLAGPTGDVDSDNQLDANETWAYTCSLTAQDGTHTNVATASATGLSQPLSDNAVYIGLFTKVFDPPTATKYLTAAGGAEVETRMVWINSGNSAAINVQVTDAIPSGTVYVPGSLTCAPFGSSVTAGSASAPLSMSAVPSSACGYDSATNRIQWQGNIAPNYGVVNELSATNKVIITFRVSLLSQTNTISNIAYGLVDSDNDGFFTDEVAVPAAASASNTAVFNRYQEHHLPVTGFNPYEVTKLAKQPETAAYTDLGMILEIPSLNVSAPIMAVPQGEQTWDVTWLGSDSIGWLEGTAFPTQAGNSVLTGHVLDENNNPGPFSALKDMKEGDTFTINAWGTVHTYVVRESKLHFAGTEVQKIVSEDAGTWVTLVTCEFWNPLASDFMFRRAVTAELVE